MLHTNCGFDIFFFTKYREINAPGGYFSAPFAPFALLVSGQTPNPKFSLFKHNSELIQEGAKLFTNFIQKGEL